LSVLESMTEGVSISDDTTEQSRRTMDEAQKAIERELMLLIEASGQLLSSPGSPDVLRTIIELAQRFVTADAYAVWRQEKETGAWKITSFSGLSDEYGKKEFVSALDALSLPGEPVLFEDIRREPLLRRRRRALQREGIRSMLLVPLRINGEPSGTVVFYWRAPHKFSAGEVRIGTALGNLAAAALGAAELYDSQIQLRAQAEWLEGRSALLAEAGAILSSSLDYNVTLANVAKLAVPRFADWCTVDVTDELGELRRLAVEHTDPEKVRFAYEFQEKYPPREDDLVTYVFRTGEPVLLEEIPEQLIVERARDPEHLQLLRELGLTSAMAVPMILDDRAVGVITFVSTESKRRYTAADLQLAEELARRAAVAIRHARLYADVRANEERLRLAVSAAGLGVWERNLRTGELIASEQCKRNVGADPGKPLIYGELCSRVHPEDRDKWQEASRRAVEEPSTFQTEHRISWPDGSLHWVLAYERCLCDADGTPERVVGVTVDVTERKNAEDERKQLLAREREARRTAELLKGIGPLLLSELDSQKLIQKVTDIASALIGAQVGAYVSNCKGEIGEEPVLSRNSGLAPGAFARIPAACYEELLESSYRGKTAVRIEDVTKDPRYAGNMSAPILVRSYLGTRVRSRAGGVFGALLFGHERPGVFTEQHEKMVSGIAAQAAIALDNARLFKESKRVQDELRRSNDELRRANEDLNQFAYSASHDLQEPLRMVAVFTQILQRQYAQKLDANANQYINYAVQGAKRMEMLVKDLLAYTRTANIDTEPAVPVSSDNVFDQALSNLSTSIEESRAVIDRCPLPRVYVHGVHLLQLFQNLVGNAIKYRNPDEPPHITVSSEPLNDFYQFCISDNGIGIPRAYWQQIFGVFKRLHSGDMYPGTGIGLAICQRIVERYGGRIWVESEEGRGSSFYFTLPKGSGN
jgi:signal transduction histidine kinase/PAS domain-containing protein